MTSPAPLYVQLFVAALEARGYALWPSSDLRDDDAHAWIMELAPDLPGGQVWILRVDDQWHVGINFAGILRSPLEVADVIDGHRSARQKSVPRVEDAGQMTLRTLDRLHGDPAVAARVWRILGPQPEDPALEGHGNDPCWCGSGKKIKRCHKTLQP